MLSSLQVEELTKYMLQNIVFEPKSVVCFNSVAAAQPFYASSWTGTPPKISDVKPGNHDQMVLFGLEFIVF